MQKKPFNLPNYYYFQAYLFLKKHISKIKSHSIANKGEIFFPKLKVFFFKLDIEVS